MAVVDLMVVAVEVGVGEECYAEADVLVLILGVEVCCWHDVVLLGVAVVSKSMQEWVS